MLEEGRKQGHERGLSEGRSLEKEFLILKMLKNNLSIDQIAAITDKTADEITADNENDDIDTIDFESLTNDTPREYVSISINTHKEKE